MEKQEKNYPFVLLFFTTFALLAVIQSGSLMHQLIWKRHSWSQMGDERFTTLIFWAIAVALLVCYPSLRRTFPEISERTKKIVCYCSMIVGLLMAIICCYIPGWH